MKKLFLGMLICSSFGLNASSQPSTTTKPDQAANETSKSVEHTKPTGPLPNQFLLPNSDQLSQSEFIEAKQICCLLQKHVMFFNNKAHGKKAMLAGGLTFGSLFFYSMFSGLSDHNKCYKIIPKNFQHLDDELLYTSDCVLGLCKECYHIDPKLLKAEKWISGAAAFVFLIWFLNELSASNQRKLINETNKTLNQYNILNEEDKDFFLDAFDEVEDQLEKKCLEKQLHLISDEVEKLYFEAKQIDEQQNEYAKVENIVKFYQSVLTTILKQDFNLISIT